MRETKLRVRIFGDPVLRKRSLPVKKITEEERKILSSMTQIMYGSSGIGLAAPQVGVNECMIVADIGDGLYKLINPTVIKRKGKQVLEEGCLSVPEICIKIKRAKTITVKALDEYGKPLEIKASGLLACVLQHEIDHLKGKLIVDYASVFQKMKIKNKLAELRKRAKDENPFQSEAKSCKLQL